MKHGIGYFGDQELSAKIQSSNAYKIPQGRVIMADKAIS